MKRQPTRSYAVLLIAAGLIAIWVVGTHDLLARRMERWLPEETLFVAPLALLPGALMLGYVLSRAGNRWTLWAGSVIGFLGGWMCFPGLAVFGELARRMLRAITGGRGQEAALGEPLFYIILGVPIGLLGAIIGMSLVAVVRLVIRKSSGIEKLDDHRNA